MDTLSLSSISCDVHIGVPPEERRSPQTLLIDACLELDLKAAGRGDDLSKSVDYQRLEVALRKHAQASRCRLIEALAESLADLALQSCPAARSVTITVRKFPKIMPKTREVAVEITRRRP